MNKKELYGVVPIVPTPFTENEEVDEEALKKLIDFAIGNGTRSGVSARLCK